MEKMGKIERLKRIHELKQQQKNIMYYIKKWDAMPNYKKASSFYRNEIMSLYHNLSDVNLMIDYAKKGIYTNIYTYHEYDIIYK